MKKRLVLVGAGHAHMTTLSRIGEYVERGHDVTVISLQTHHYYSGMGPGLLGGRYEPREVRFNVRRMAEAGGARFVAGQVSRVDAVGRLLYLKGEEGQDAIPYDVASFNTGSEIVTKDVSNTSDTIIPVKPILNLYRARQRISELARSGRSLLLLVVGGGPAGVEIAGNLWRWMRRTGATGEILLVGGSRLLKDHPERVRHLAVESLRRREIDVMEGVHVSAWKQDRVELTCGQTVRYDAAFLCIGIRPSSLFSESGLVTGRDNGLLVGETLNAPAHPELFGGGDCIAFGPGELPKSGVYAVRQNPVLFRNLMNALEGRPLEPFKPGGSTLLIMNMGDGRGIAWKAGWTWNGRSAFWFKEYLDRRFMRMFQKSGELSESFDPGTRIDTDRHG